jgi:hypothetical protein
MSKLFTIGSSSRSLITGWRDHSLDGVTRRKTSAKARWRPLESAASLAADGLAPVPSTGIFETVHRSTG